MFIVITRRFVASMRAFAIEEKGVTLPVLALAFMMIMGFVGTATDIARLQLVQSRLTYALDAAGLAAGSTMNTTNLDTELANYMNVNFPANYMGAATPQIVSEVMSDNKVINLSATTTMPTTFMNALGITAMSVSAHSQITRTSEGLELAIVLDNTGSMSGDLSTLKNAATSLVNVLFGTHETVPNLWVGLVPFAATVNVGTSHSTWIDQTHFATLNWGSYPWRGCVDARDTAGQMTTGTDTVDDPPTSKLYKAYYYPSTYPSGQSTGVSNHNKYCTAAITPLTAYKSTILTGINNMTTDGNTHVGLGAIWGWNMLSPRWRGQWGGEMDAAALPLDYGTKHMNKAVIIMTDGANTMSTNIFSAYGWMADNRLGSTWNTTTAVTNLNAKLSTVCTNMKAKGIYVYTIAFRNPGTTIQNLMKACATADNYYFSSPDPASLNTAFNAIADSLSNLRVSE